MDQPECINQSIDIFWVVLIIVILMIIMNLVQRLISGWVLKESQFNDNIQWLLLDTRRSYIHITVKQLQRSCTCPCADILYYDLCRRGRGTSRLQPSVKNFGIFQKKLQLETDGTTVSKDGNEMLSGQFVLVPIHGAWINRKDQGQVHGLFCASA